MFIINKRKFIALFTSAVLMVNGISVSALSQDSVVVDENSYQFPITVQILVEQNAWGEVKCQTPLYGANHGIIGYCLDFDNSYLIYDISGNVIEFSSEFNSPFFEFEGVAYYGGPLLYCEKVNDNFVNLVTHENITVDSFSQIESQRANSSDESLSMKNSIRTMSATPTYTEQNVRTTGTPRALDCNVNGTCSQVACAIMLVYYHDYISTKYTTDFFASYPEALHDFLISKYLKYYDGSYGQSYKDIKSGIDQYFKDNNIANSVNYTIFEDVYAYSYYKNSLCNQPLILGLYENEESSSYWSMDHWVVEYGYKDILADGKRVSRYYLINDGYGRNGVYMLYDEAYVSGAVGFSY